VWLEHFQTILQIRVGKACHSVLFRSLAISVDDSPHSIDLDHGKFTPLEALVLQRVEVCFLFCLLSTLKELAGLL